MASKAPTGEYSQSYLARLSVSASMRTSVVARYITNVRVVLLGILTITLLGFLAYNNLPKRLNPEVKIPIVTIITILPGAGPSDVESLVTIPIEDELRSLKGVDTLTSSSVENVSAITIQFLSSVDREKAKTDVQSAVDGVRDLPSDAQTPQVNLLDFEDQPIWTFALVSSKTVPDLMRSAQALKESIEDVPSVDRVIVNGFETQEIVVTVDPAKLATYGISPFSLADSLKKARTSYPAGSVQTAANTYALTIDATIESIADIRALQVSVNGQTIALSEIASIAYRSKMGTFPSYYASPDAAATPAVTFAVYKTTGTNIDAAGEAVAAVVDPFMETQSDLKLVTLLNTSKEIEKQFEELLGEFRATILLVMIVLLLFLGLRQALISSLTVPLTFLSAFFFMQYFGMSINFLSLFAFLLALGLLVDDTIVVVSAMTAYYRSGKFSPVETGLLVWKDTIIPIWSTTLTTIWSFVPLLLASGIIGEFIKPIPIVVTVTMLSSTAIAVLITLPLMIVLLKPAVPARVLTLLKMLAVLAALAVVITLTINTPIFLLVLVVYFLLTILLWKMLPALRQASTRTIHSLAKYQSPQLQTASSYFRRLVEHGIVNLESFSAWYSRSIAKILSNTISRRRVLLAVVLYAIVGFALLPLGFVKNEFFPKSDENELFVQVEYPAGSTAQKTEENARALLDELRSSEEVAFVTLDVGSSAPGGFGGAQSASNLALFSLRLTDDNERTITSPELAEQLRSRYKNYTQGTLSVVENTGGPPAGADVQLKVVGDDLPTLNALTDDLVAFLEENPALTNVNKSVQEGTSKLVFVPDPVKLADYGIGRDAVGFLLRLYASGFTLDEIQLDQGSEEKTAVVLKMQNTEADPSGLTSLSVTTPQGQRVPLVELGRLEARVNPTSITRENFSRALSVSAAARPGASISEENAKLLRFAETLKLPAGYEWKTGGVNDENARSVQSILQAMVLSAILILITMVIQFSSFRQAIIVLIVIPLAVSSVFYAFALTGTPLSFPALIGVLSLFGIVVTNSMFIVDKINLNTKEGMEFVPAIADAGASRMEPIILTKLSTVVGLLPITIADPLWRGLGGAIISGLLIASTIMLLFIPVLYYEWMKPTNEKPSRR